MVTSATVSPFASASPSAVSSSGDMPRLYRPQHKAHEGMNTTKKTPERRGQPWCEPRVFSDDRGPWSTAGKASRSSLTVAAFVCFVPFVGLVPCDRWRAALKSEPVQLAHVHGLRAREEGLAHDPGTRRSRELPGVPVDLGPDDAFGFGERRVRPASQRLGHEGDPDWQRRLGAAQAERLIVVHPYPYDRQQFRREAHEPGVAQIVGRAGLASGV